LIEPAKFLTELERHQISFFAGVPDSLLASLISEITASCTSDKHVICANEGSSIALACGHYLSTGNIACVYMQNSGLGNAINPLMSLSDAQVYGIPTLLLIGWRGEPGVEDEPQHKKQGAITLDLLKTLGIQFSILDKNSNLKEVVASAVAAMHKSKSPYALLVRADTFKANGDSVNNTNRENAIELLANAFGNDAVFVATTGKIGRELFEIREKNQQKTDSDFLCVGGMGHASQVALGISLAKPSKHVICLDGDGAALMHLGHLATIGHKGPKKFVHILLNNRVHDSVGGQATTNPDLNFSSLARQVGYRQVFQCLDVESLKQVVTSFNQLDGPIFIEVLLEPGSRPDLGRPKCVPAEAKDKFMRCLES
jgi:phosphonopyruvate decarboxylase